MSGTGRRVAGFKAVVCLLVYFAHIFKTLSYLALKNPFIEILLCEDTMCLPYVLFSSIPSIVFSFFF